MSKRTLLLTATLVAGAVASAAAQSPNTKAGVLTCQTSASLGLIVGSQQKLRCQFSPDNGGQPDKYTGVINRLGVDLGITTGGVMTWVVLAPTNGVLQGALAGKFVGASGDVSLGLGVGANVLVGGSQRSIALQPISVEGQKGVNLALGVAGLTLRSAD